MSVSFKIRKRSLKNMLNKMSPNTKLSGTNCRRETGSLQDRPKNHTEYLKLFKTYKTVSVPLLVRLWTRYIFLSFNTRKFPELGGQQKWTSFSHIICFWGTSKMNLILKLITQVVESQIENYFHYRVWCILQERVNLFRLWHLPIFNWFWERGIQNIYILASYVKNIFTFYELNTFFQTVGNQKNYLIFKTVCYSQCLSRLELVLTYIFHVYGDIVKPWL